MILLFLLLSALASSANAYISIITGANGFVGRQVVYSLLQQRNGDSKDAVICLVYPDKVPREETYWNDHVMDQDDDNVCVKVLPYDMLDGGETLNDALKTAITYYVDHPSESCPICIYHIASVFGPTADPIQTANDNVQSAEDVVRTLDKFYQSHPNAKLRLVLTSSMAAVRATDQKPLNGKFYTHRDWNTLSKLNGENWGSCYQYSKAESERRAFELVKECNEKYAKEKQIEIVALCPSFVFGPPPPMPSKMTDTTKNGSSSFSLTLINQWLRGESPVQSRLCLDVRDCAEAHIAAGRMNKLPDEDVDRRYILSAEERLSSEATAEALMRGVERATKDSLRTIDLSKMTCDTQFTGGAIPIGQQEVEATERLKRDLGVVCRPVEETMQDMAEALLLGGVLE